jgi:phage FluMu protein Com
MATAPSTTRCKYCGVKLTQTTLPDGTVVMQCPKCKYTAPVTDQNSTDNP